MHWLLKRESDHRVGVWANSTIPGVHDELWYTCQSDLALIGLVRSLTMDADERTKIVVSDAITATLLAAARHPYVWDSDALARRASALIVRLGVQPAARLFVRCALLEGVSEQDLNAMASLVADRIGSAETVAFFSAMSVSIQAVQRGGWKN